MDEILHADDAKLAKSTLHQVVGGDGGAVAIDLRRDILDLEILYLISLCYPYYQCLKLFPDITPTEGMGNVGYRKNQSRTAYSPATQNKKLANFCPSPLLAI